MLDGEKNLNDLLFFAQSLIKDIELKKQEIAHQSPEQKQEDQSPSRRAGTALTSLREERDKALRYKEWKKNFCEEGSSRNRLARSVERLNEVEAEWTSQKKVYQKQAMNMSLFSEIQLFTEKESPQDKSPRYNSVRGSRWDNKSNPKKNSYNSLNPMQRSYYSRSSSQECFDKESPKQNAGAKDVRNSKASATRKGSTGTPKNNNSIAKANSYQSLNSSRAKYQERNSQSPSQKKVETPVSKSKTIFGDSSPNKKDYLKRKTYSIQRKSSIDTGNPTASTNFSSAINSARQQVESPQTKDNKSENLIPPAKADEQKRGRQASPNRGVGLTNAAEIPAVPIVTKINLSEWTKHTAEIKEKSYRGHKDSQNDSSMWSSEKLILSLKVRSSLGDRETQRPDLTNLKELFPADSKSSARISTNTNTENSPIKSAKIMYSTPRQDKSLNAEDIIGEGGASSPSKFAKYSIFLKEKPQLNESRNYHSSRQLDNSENRKHSRSSSCRQEKEQPYSTRNRNKSPASSRDKLAALQVQEDLKLLSNDTSIEKWKKSKEGNKEISCEDIDLQAEKEKLYKDILDKLHSQKQKGKAKSKQMWIY